jgi:hypothetical protein
VGERVRTLLRGSKDAALAFTARTFLNTRLRVIGEVSELSIDTTSRACRLRLDLLGEAEPIDIHITKYALKQSGEKTMLMVVGATASRKWLAAALREFVVGQTFAIPAKAGGVLNLLA